MARNAKPKDETQPTGRGDVLFINYDLDEASKGKFRKWRELHEKDVPDMLQSLIDGNYQVSIKPDTFNDCVGAFIICKDAKSENAGYILTGRGLNAFGALMGVLYRHFAVFEGQWPVHNHRAALLDDD